MRWTVLGFLGRAMNLKRTTSELREGMQTACAFLNGGGGLYTMTLVGVPEPACGHTGTTPPACTVLSLTVSSNVSGRSVP